MPQPIRITGKSQRPLKAIGLLLVLLHTANAAWAKDETGDAACPAHDQLRPLLNSERIQSCFGSYGVEVLEQQGNLRISSLYSLAADSTGNREQGSLPQAGGRSRAPALRGTDASVLSGSLAAEIRITRTLAISEFATDLPKSLQPTYEAIRAGASMGASLQAAGWRVDKRHRYFGEVPASDAFRCMSGLPENHPQQVLAVQVYDLYALRDDEEVRFALLAELHDPRYLTLQDLQELYPGQAGQTQTADAASTLLLERALQVCADH